MFSNRIQTSAGLVFILLGTLLGPTANALVNFTSDNASSECNVEGIGSIRTDAQATQDALKTFDSAGLSRFATFIKTTVPKLKTHNQDLTEEQPSILLEMAWLPILLKLREETLSRPEYLAFSQNKLFQFDFDLPYGVCPLACVTINMTIGIDIDLTQDLYLQDPSEFESTMRFILNHEIGHIANMINLWQSGKHKNSSELMTAYRSQPKVYNHIMVDLFAKNVANLSFSEIKKALQQIEKIISKSRSSDLNQRLSCTEQILKN